MRRNKVIFEIAIACATLWCCAIAPGQNAAGQNGTTTDSINGNWTVTFTILVSEKQAQTVSGQMTFQAHGEKLGGRVETKHTGQGTLKGGAWSHNKLSGIYVFESHEAIAIAGELREGKLAGVFRTEGLDGKWEAVRADAQP